MPYQDTWPDIEFLSSYQGRYKGLTLDLGGGRGRISDQLSDAGVNVVVSDIDRPSLVHAVARHPAVLGDAHWLPFRDASFDNVVCSFVLEHIQNPSHVVQEVARALDQGDHLVVLVPCRRGIPKIFGSFYAKLVHWVGHPGHGHVEIHQNYSLGDVMTLLESAHFRVKHARSGRFVLTSLLASKYHRFSGVHRVLSRIIETLHLNFLTINTEFHCVLEETYR
jgi:2-polyprenyl-3-methyl-5-hydroxy-6-metoxy-1,4-benzoquinol methylase